VPLSILEPLNFTMSHVQFFTMHLKTLSNRAHRGQKASEFTVPCCSNRAIGLFLINLQDALRSQLTVREVVFSSIVPMAAPR